MSTFRISPMRATYSKHLIFLRLPP